MLFLIVIPISVYGRMENDPITNYDLNVLIGQGENRKPAGGGLHYLQ